MRRDRSGQMRIDTTAVRRAVHGVVGSGRAAIIEVGTRVSKDGGYSTNLIAPAMTDDDSDLFDVSRLTDNRWVEAVEAYPGLALFDCYCYSRGPSGELETNVWVGIKDGVIVAASEKDNVVRAVLGVPD